MPFAENAIHRRFVRKRRQNRDRESEAAQRPAGDEQQAPNRRKPVRVERHHPINRRKADDQNKENHRRTAKTSTHRPSICSASVIVRLVLPAATIC